MDINRKLEIFAKGLDSEARALRDEALKLIERRKKTTLDKIKKEALEKADNTLEQELSRLRQSQKRELALYEYEAKKRLLLRREELMEEIFGSVKISLEEYTVSEEYRVWLSQKLEEETEKNPDASIVLRQADFEVLKPENAVCSEDVSIGGYKLILDGGRRVVDNTLGAKLKSQRESFQGFEGPV